MVRFSNGFGLILAGLMLAAAPYYDEAAYPSAESVRSTDIDKCREPTKATVIKWMECVLVVEREFAATVKLKDAGFWEVYEDRMRLLAIDMREGKLNLETLAARYAKITTDFHRMMQLAADAAAAPASK